jgi:hypothetical protein
MGLSRIFYVGSHWSGHGKVLFVHLSPWEAFAGAVSGLTAKGGITIHHLAAVGQQEMPQVCRCRSGPPELQAQPATLDKIYVKSPITGGQVPLSTLLHYDTAPVSLLSVSHQGQFPAVTLSFNLAPGVALGQAVDAIQKAEAWPSSIWASAAGPGRPRGPPARSNSKLPINTTQTVTSQQSMMR